MINLSEILRESENAQKIEIPWYKKILSFLMK